jgi:hypothetical protein
MYDFIIKALEFGVLGLCAVMLVFTLLAIYREQKRTDTPRKGIIWWSIAFMGFCILLAVLNSYVQLSEKQIANQHELSISRQVLKELMDLKGGKVERLGELDPKSSSYIDLVNEIQKDLLEIDKSIKNAINVN